MHVLNTFQTHVSRTFQRCRRSLEACLPPSAEVLSVGVNWVRAWVGCRRGVDVNIRRWGGGKPVVSISRLMSTLTGEARLRVSEGATAREKGEC